MKSRVHFVVGQKVRLICFLFSFWLYAGTVYAVECSDTYFSDIEVNKPLIGPMPGKGEGTVVCLVTCYENAGGKSHNGTAVVKEFYRNYVQDRVSEEKLDEILANIRILYSTRSVNAEITEECLVTELAVSESLAARLYEEVSKSSNVDQQRLLDAIEGSQPARKFSADLQVGAFRPIVAIDAEEGSAGRYLRGVLQEEAFSAGLTLSKENGDQNLVIDTLLNVGGEAAIGYEMGVTFVLSEVTGVQVGTLALSSEMRVNRLTPESRRNLARLAMAGNTSLVKELLTKGKTYLVDQGGPLYTVKASTKTGVSSNVLLALLKSIEQVKIESTSQEDIFAIALIRFPGGLTPLYDQIEQRIDSTFKAVRYPVPEIEFLQNQILIK